MKRRRVLVTCRQMQDSLPALADELSALGWELKLADLGDRQQFSSAEMSDLLVDVEGAIIGDDEISDLALAKADSLIAICKWGIGIDSIDLEATERRAVRVGRTPQMFGEEVADVALAYTIGLARNLFEIDRGVRSGAWPKPIGRSLRGLRGVIIGYGDVGQALALRLQLIGFDLTVVEPSEANSNLARERGLQVSDLQEACQGANFLHVTCPLTTETRGLINQDVFVHLANPAYVVNVARGPIVDGQALVAALEAGLVTGAALDVFENEPPGANNTLVSSPRVILGSHNASNSYEATIRASSQALRVLDALLSEHS